MIPKNLKPGDVFTDGGMWYCVDSVKEDTYLSHRVPEPKKEPEQEPEQAPKAGRKKAE